MTAEQMRAYEWAKNQSYQSVAARYAKELCGVIAALQAENAELRKQRPVQVDGDVMALALELAETKAALSRVEAERDAALKRLKKIDELCIAFRDAGSSGLADMFARDIMEISGPQGEA